MLASSESRPETIAGGSGGVRDWLLSLLDLRAPSEDDNPELTKALTARRDRPPSASAYGGRRELARLGVRRLRAPSAVRALRGARHGPLRPPDVLCTQDTPRRDPLARDPRASVAGLPSVDIVVTSYNEDPDALGECLDSLVAQDYPGEVNVYVVDDARPTGPSSPRCTSSSRAPGLARSCPQPGTEESARLRTTRTSAVPRRDHGDDRLRHDRGSRRRLRDRPPPSRTNGSAPSPATSA